MIRTFEADANWADLAKARKLRLPRHNAACTTGQMERWLRKLGLSVQFYKDWSGFKTLRDWRVKNPEWGLRSFVGCMLEATETPRSDTAKQQESLF